MDCEQACARMAGALLGELGDAERAAFEAHLAACFGCRADYEGLRAGFAIHPTGERATRVAAVEKRILAAGKAELARERKDRRKRWLMWTVGSAAAIAITVLAARLSMPPSVPVASQADRVAEDAWCFVNGDAANSRRLEASELGIPAQTMWEAQVPGAAGTYKPLAWNHLVIVGTPGAGTPFLKGGGLAALDARNGSVVWRKTFAQGDYFKAKGFPDRCILQGKLYLTDGNACRVLDAASGEELAVFAAPGEAEGWSYLGAQDERLYGVSRDGRTIFCVDRGSGATVWCRAAGGRVFIPALLAERLFLQTSDGALTALGGSDGRILWRRASCTPAGKGSVYATGDRVLVLTDNDELTACDATRGERLWHRKIPLAHQSGLALGRAAAYLLAGRMALDLGDGHTLWQRMDAAGGPCAPPTVVGSELLYTGAATGCLNVLSDAGAFVASVEEVGSHACEGAIVARGRVYTGCDGRFFALAACRGE